MRKALSLLVRLVGAFAVAIAVTCAAAATTDASRHNSLLFAIVALLVLIVTHRDER